MASFIIKPAVSAAGFFKSH